MEKVKVKGFLGLIIPILVFSIITGVTNFALFTAKCVDYAMAKKASASVTDEVKADGKGNIGDYNVELKSHKISKDTLVLEISFENLSDKAISFDSAINVEVYQDGIQIPSTIDYENDNSGLKVKPSKKLTVVKKYKVSNANQPANVEFYLVGGSDEPVISIDCE